MPDSTRLPVGSIRFGPPVHHVTSESPSSLSAERELAKLTKDLEGAMTGGRIAVDRANRQGRELDRLRLDLELLAEDPPPTHAELLAAIQRLAAA